VVITFGLTRLLALKYPEGRRSTVEYVFASYGYEKFSAYGLEQSVYELHESAPPLPLGTYSISAPGSRTIEYPPLALDWMALPYWLIRPRTILPEPLSPLTREKYTAIMAIELVLVDALCLFLVAVVLSRWMRVPLLRLTTGTAAYVLGGAILFVIAYDRMDLLVGALLITALACLFSSLSLIAAGVALALAINFKIVAVLAVPAFVIGSLKCSSFKRSHSHALRCAITYTAALGLLSALLFLPYLLRDGLRTLTFLTFHTARGIQIESLPANVLFLLSRLGLPVRVVWEYGAADVQSPAAGAVSVLSAVAMLAVEGIAVSRLWRTTARAVASCEGDRRVAQQCPGLIARYTALHLAIGICGAKVFSPQYVLWLLPLFPIACSGQRGRDRECLEVGLLVTFLTTLVFPLLYTEVRPHLIGSGGEVTFLPPTLIGLAVLTNRSLSMVWFTVVLWREWPSAHRPLFGEASGSVAKA
jgi:hypothetical protein